MPTNQFIEDIEDGIDAERLGWTCVCILGMIFPAQFEEAVSRCYMGMSLFDQARWMSCSVKTVRNLYTLSRKNMRIIRRFLEETCDI